MELWEYVYRVFDLDSFERFCVSCAAKAEICGQDSLNGGEITVGNLAGACQKQEEMCEVYSYFHEDSTLMRYFFLADKREPFIERRLRLHPRMSDLLMGKGYIFPAAYQNQIRIYEPDLEKEPQTPVGERLLRLLEGYRKEESWVIQLCARKGSGRKYAVREVFSYYGSPVLSVRADIFRDTSDQGRLREILNDILRECIYFQAGLVMEDADAGLLNAGVVERLLRTVPILFATCEKQIFFDTETAASFCFPVNLPDYRQSQRLWKEAFREYTLAEEVEPDNLASQYELVPGKIFSIADEAYNQARLHGRTAVTQEDLHRACRSRLSMQMGKKAVRTQSPFVWEQLVLPEYQKRMLRTACRQVQLKNRVGEAWSSSGKMTYGRGISMIFSGLPGTGKTMAAQVMANVLGMDLYKVELSAVVSKYIGETEKNLEEIFEQAEEGYGILFFDEADVLFSKRTEVRNSNDKYSNMEAAYMLQKIESYDGITILSTNYLQNFDEAFKRRMKMIIDFPFPDEEHRKILWKQVFPDRIAVDEEVDFDFLAKHFDFSGSNIKNAAFYASFCAADGQRPVGMADLAAGVKNECAKIGKILRAEDMGEYYLLFRECDENV